MKIQQNIIDILASSEVDGNKLTLPGQLDRATYQQVDKVLKALDAKWDRKAGGHVFKEDAADLIDDVLATGEYRRIKVDLQQFDTPDDIAQRVVDLADIRYGDLVLEPSCGPGNLVKAAITKTSQLQMHLYEFDSKRMDKCLADHFATCPPGSFTRGDFLLSSPDPKFDRVLMNPPFSKAQDIGHVTHAFRFLKPGGILVSIMSPGVKFRQGKKYDAFRALMDAHDGEIFDVDAGAFAESGTRIRTVIVKMVA